MFSRTPGSLRHTLALRLTVWYAGIFAISSILAFALVYVLMASMVQERTDEDLHGDIEEFILYLQAGGIERVKSEMALEAQDVEASQTYFRLWTKDGTRLAATDLTSWSELMPPRESELRLVESDEPIARTLDLPQREDRVRSIHGAIAPGLVLEIGQSIEDDDELIEALLNAFLMGLAAVIVLGGPIGWFLARRALGGVENITQTAIEIAHGALDRRVSVGNRGDELDQLAQTFNTMLDRIQSLIVGMREVTDNLAHDLRSPLTRIRASAEMALAGDELSPEQGSLAATMTEECDRLLEMINVTLDIAEAESGAAELNIVEIELVDVVRNACDLFQTVAEDKQISIVTNLPRECTIHGDLQRLQRVVANLLDNALKYTPAGGQVRVVLLDEGGSVKLSIEDTGTGISSDELSHIFQRFYRCERSRSQHGNGLGLSLALAFVRAHGGDLMVRSTPGVGSTFSVELARPKTH